MDQPIRYLFNFLIEVLRVVLPPIVFMSLGILVFEYLPNSPFRWVGVGIALYGFYLLKRGQVMGRFTITPKGPKLVQYVGPDRSFFEPESERSFRLHDVVRIEIETTGDGPFDEDLYWIFHLNGEQPVRMAGPVAMGAGIFDVLEGFVGADMEKVVESASVVDPALFSIWVKYRPAP